MTLLMSECKALFPGCQREERQHEPGARVRVQSGDIVLHRQRVQGGAPVQVVGPGAG